MSEKLHYDKHAVEADCTSTFGGFMKVAMVGVAGAVVYFFALAVYLGGWSHTRAPEFVETFVPRVELEYKGKKLPMYENPELAHKFDVPANSSEPQHVRAEAK